MPAEEFFIGPAINIERMTGGDHADWHRDRVRAMYRWADRYACRHRGVVGWFGEHLDDCGTSCDVCTGIDLLADAAAPRRTLVDVTDEVDGELFERLRSLRKELADERDVPAYVVFSDATLRAMAATRPQTEGALLAISGVGPAKLERYGDAFLAVLRET